MKQGSIFVSLQNNQEKNILMDVIMVTSPELSTIYLSIIPFTLSRQVKNIFFD